MRIRQIELNGFKSFMERTVLELPSGVTAIVGPNGCGKSNVVDAIRWVLGEQSPKHLRGAVMEDVVFSGNATFGPLGMAEVSLLLERDAADLDAELPDENGTGAPAEGDVSYGLPPGLAQASEILVTRRYFRSGESEYFINQAPCRLRDITELFLGTGVGTKAYAIIEQGRVDQLLNAKPQELRLFLEEAAGTTRFRSRKLAAERKMERTRENLVRVQDVVRELERQRTSLERQARRAEEYRRIKAELRDLDLCVAAGRYDEWSRDLLELEDTLAASHSAESALQGSIDRSRASMSEARAAEIAQEAHLREIEEALATQRLALAEGGGRVESFRERAQEVVARRLACEEEAAQLRNQGVVARREVAVSVPEVEALATAQPGLEADREAAEAQRLELLSAGAPLEHVLETAKDALVEAIGDEARLRNLVTALGHRRDELESQQRKLEDDQRALAERLRANTHGAADIRTKIERLDAELTTLYGERSRLAAVQAELQERERVQASRVDASRMEAAHMESRSLSLRELQERHEGCARGVASLLAKEGDREGVALVARLLRVPAELERAVAVALGLRLTQLVVPDSDSAIRDIQWLTSSGGGSATLIPRVSERRAATIVPAGPRLLDRIEADAAHWALAETLLGNVLLADDLVSAIALWRAAAHEVIVVTLRGEAVDALGAMTGGSEPPIEETVLVRERELREMDYALARLKARVEDEDTELRGIRKALAQAVERTVEVERQEQELRLARLAAEKDREHADTERERILAELEGCALQVGGVAGEGGEVSWELKQLENRLVASERAVANRRQQLATAQEALLIWRREYARAEERRTEAAIVVAAAAERLRAGRIDVERRQAVTNEIAVRLESVERQIAEMGSAGERLEESRVRSDRDVQRARAAVGVLEGGRLAVGQVLAQLRSVVGADDVTEREARERLDGMRQRRAATELAMAEHRMQIDHLGAQLHERYELSIDELASVGRGDDADVEEHATRVESLRLRLSRIGDVNPGAIDELTELAERHEFLRSQREDLERSLEDLRRTIAKLARTSRRRFEETFAAANVKLGEMFPKLFPGGMAQLQMVAPSEEGEEPGVEIVVQPAGKKLQSLMLLSGGEKALTAVALILSLFLIRPTPFCLLDEVDAPLDEANIGRFNHVIREMAHGSQFVLITHNRRTMEVAETLYGITMEQAGVSKVVSVRLREAA